MANWATTSYRVEGSQNDLQELYGLIRAFCIGERTVMTDKSSKDWEGNVVLALGEEIGKNYVRGFIQYYELHENVLYIEAEEAWNATDFRHIIEKHYEEMKVYYIVEEPGCEVYATNDENGMYFDYRYLVDFSVNGIDYWEYFKTEDDALDYIASKLQIESISVEDIEKWKVDHEDSEDYICLHKFEIVE